MLLKLFKKIHPICYFVLFASIIFHYKIGIQNIWPGNVDWLLQASDWPQHYLGWEFFRRTPWHFPLGDFQNVLYPANTNIGFTDSIPLLAISLKIFSGILPNIFQYIGLWIFINIVLQGYFAYLIFKKLHFSTNSAIVGGLLLQFTPALIARVNHPALTAHWLILFVIYNYIVFNNTKKDIYLNFAPIILSSLIHPYLAIMIIPLSIANLLRFNSLKTRLITIPFAFVIPIISWYGIGYFVDYAIGDSQSLGYYSASLQTFFNPLYAIWDHHLRDASLWLDPRETRYMLQYEGFAYLGLGILIGGFIGIVFILKRLISNYKKIIPFIKKSIISGIHNKTIIFWLGIILISLYAILYRDIVSTYLEPYARLPFIRIFLDKAGIIRANGRFIWPLMYIIFIGIIYLTHKIFPKKSFYILLILLGIQIIDISPLLTLHLFKDKEFVSVKSESSIFWQNTIKEYKGVYMYPGGQRSYKSTDDYVIFTFWAAQNNIPINAGYLSRYDIAIQKKSSVDLEKDILNNNLNPNILYITTKEYKDIFENASHNTKRNITIFDDYYIIK
jgi:hypothetical protein